MKAKTNKTAYVQLAMMLCLTMGTQLILLLKSSRVAALYGTGVEMDAYNFVNNIAIFIFSFIGAGVGTVLIPYMVREKNEARAQNGFLTILYGLSVVALGICLILRRPLLTLFGGNSEEFVNIASSLMAVILFSHLITSLTSVSTAYLQCKNCFTLPKVLALFVTAIATAVIYLAQDFTIYQYAVLSFVLVLIEMTVQYVVAASRGFRYKPCIPLRDSKIKVMFWTFLPTMFGSGVYQLTLLTDSVISSTLGEGNISILSYASIISGMVNTVIANNIMLYIYPKIAAETNDEQSKKKLFQYMTFFATVMCAVVVLFIAAGYDAVRIFFERGAFGSDATEGVFVCVLIYLLGAPINIMRDVIYRYFYSKGNTKSTFYNGLTASILNMAISIILAQFMGLYGIVLGTTITAVFSFISILLRMHKQYTFDGNFHVFARELVKILFATVLSAAGCVLLKVLPLGLPSLAVSALIAVLSILVFGVVLLITRSKVFNVDLG